MSPFDSENNVLPNQAEESQRYPKKNAMHHRFNKLINQYNALFHE